MAVEREASKTLFLHVEGRAHSSAKGTDADGAPEQRIAARGAFLPTHHDALPHENLTRGFGRHGVIRIGWWTLNGD